MPPWQVTALGGQTVLQVSGLEWTMLQLLNKSVLQLSVTALFYLYNSKKIHLQGMRAGRPKDTKRRAPHRAREREREREKRALAPLFIRFSVPGPVLCKLGQPGVLFVLPEVLTLVLGPSFVLFLQAFPFQVFQPQPFWTPFPYYNYLIYDCKNWTIKKAKHQRIDTFELWCWGRLLRVPWTTRRSNQSILKVISPEYSLEGLMLQPKLQYFGHLMPTANSLEKTLMLGKIEGRRRRGRQRMRWHHRLNGHEFE